MADLTPEDLEKQKAMEAAKAKVVAPVTGVVPPIPVDPPVTANSMSGGIVSANAPADVVTDSHAAMVAQAKAGMDAQGNSPVITSGMVPVATAPAAQPVMTPAPPVNGEAGTPWKLGQLQSYTSFPAIKAAFGVDSARVSQSLADASAPIAKPLLGAEAAVNAGVGAVKNWFDPANAPVAPVVAPVAGPVAPITSAANIAPYSPPLPLSGSGGANPSNVFSNPTITADDGSKTTITPYGTVGTGGPSLRPAPLGAQVPAYLQKPTGTIEGVPSEKYLQKAADALARTRLTSPNNMNPMAQPYVGSDGKTYRNTGTNDSSTSYVATLPVPGSIAESTTNSIKSMPIGPERDKAILAQGQAALNPNYNRSVTTQDPNVVNVGDGTTVNRVTGQQMTNAPTPLKSPEQVGAEELNRRNALERIRVSQTPVHPGDVATSTTLNSLTPTAPAIVGTAAAPIVASTTPVPQTVQDVEKAQSQARIDQANASVDKDKSRVDNLDADKSMADAFSSIPNGEPLHDASIAQGRAAAVRQKALANGITDDQLKANPALADKFMVADNSFNAVGGPGGTTATNALVRSILGGKDYPAVVNQAIANNSDKYNSGVENMRALSQIKPQAEITDKAESLGLRGENLSLREQKIVDLQTANQEKASRALATKQAAFIIAQSKALEAQNAAAKKAAGMLSPTGAVKDKIEANDLIIQENQKRANKLMGLEDGPEPEAKQEAPKPKPLLPSPPIGTVRNGRTLIAEDGSNDANWVKK